MFTANFALKRFFTGVKVFVLDGVSAHGESFSAHFTLVLGGTFVGAHVHFHVVFRRVFVVAQVTTVLPILAVTDRVQSERYVILVCLVAYFALDRIIQLHGRRMIAP